MVEWWSGGVVAWSQSRHLLSKAGTMQIRRPGGETKGVEGRRVSDLLAGAGALRFEVPKTL